MPVVVVVPRCGKRFVYLKVEITDRENVAITSGGAIAFSAISCVRFPLHSLDIIPFRTLSMSDFELSCVSSDIENFLPDLRRVLEERLSEDPTPENARAAQEEIRAVIQKLLVRLRDKSPLYWQMESRSQNQAAGRPQYMRRR